MTRTAAEWAEKYPNPRRGDCPDCMTPTSTVECPGCGRELGRGCSCTPCPEYCQECLDEDEIRDTLRHVLEVCSSRALDSEEDREVVIEELIKGLTVLDWPMHS